MGFLTLSAGWALPTYQREPPRTDAVGAGMCATGRLGPRGTWRARLRPSKGTVASTLTGRSHAGVDVNPNSAYMASAFSPSVPLMPKAVRAAWYMAPDSLNKTKASSRRPCARASTAAE